MLGEKMKGLALESRFGRGMPDVRPPLPEQAHDGLSGRSMSTRQKSYRNTGVALTHYSYCYGSRGTRSAVMGCSCVCQNPTISGRRRIAVIPATTLTIIGSAHRGVYPPRSSVVAQSDCRVIFRILYSIPNPTRRPCLSSIAAPLPRPL